MADNIKQEDMSLDNNSATLQSKPIAESVPNLLSKDIRQLAESLQDTGRDTNISELTENFKNLNVDSSDRNL